MNKEKITVREACRRRMPLGGVDAQALEHGMTQLEEENRKLQKMYDDLDFKTRLAISHHPEGCVQAGMMLKAEIGRLRTALQEIYEREGPGPDGSSENESGRIARKALAGS